MQRAWIHRLPLLVLSGIALIGSGGCLDFLNGNDDDSGDTLPTDPEQLAVLDEIAYGVTETAFDAAIGAMQRMVEWSEGIPIVRNFAWDAETQGWTLTEGGEYSDGDAQGVMSQVWWVQFRAGGQIQQQPDELTDEIEIHVNPTNAGIYDPGDFQIAYDWVAGHEVTGHRNPDNSAGAVGSGWLNGETTTTLNGDQFDNGQAMTWSHTFSMAPKQACVSGTLEGSMSPWDFDAVFDGLGGYSYELRRNDEVIDSGFDTYTCAPQE
jgi:hypothetical protein